MKMLKKEAEQRQAVEMLCTDMLVPREHLLRKIDAAVNFARIYDLVEDLYCEDNGRPSCDPVVLFKLVLIQHLFGIRSLRQTMRDAEVNVAYRWFLGYTMSQQLPHFATISYAFRHRFTAEVIEGVFRWILEEVARAGYLSPEVVFVDGTHIKANANLKKQVKKAIPVAAKRYQEQLDEEIEADRAAHGKKPLKKDDDDNHPAAPGKQKIVAESTTDPESGVFHKGEHRKCFAYEAHTVCDRRGYILETEITPGNVHDSVAFDAVFERLKTHYPEVQVVTADAGYKTPWICKQIFDSGKIPSLPYKRPMTKKGNLPWYAYVYDDYYDCVLCPQDKVLSYATTNREGYREYKSKGYICQSCSVRENCTQNRQYTKTVTRHIWQEYLERAEDIRHSPIGKATYALRSQTIERVFADAKEKHAMRYTLYRGLAAVTAWVKLKFAAMNLKKLALHKWRPLSYFYFLLLQEATLLRCKVASLTRWGKHPDGCFPHILSKEVLEGPRSLPLFYGQRGTCRALQNIGPVEGVPVGQVLGAFLHLRAAQGAQGGALGADARLQGAHGQGQLVGVLVIQLHLQPGERILPLLLKGGEPVGGGLPVLGLGELTHFRRGAGKALGHVLRPLGEPQAPRQHRCQQRQGNHPIGTHGITILPVLLPGPGASACCPCPCPAP